MKNLEKNIIGLGNKYISNYVLAGKLACLFGLITALGPNSSSGYTRTAAFKLYG